MDLEEVTDMRIAKQPIGIGTLFAALAAAAPAQVPPAGGGQDPAPPAAPPVATPDAPPVAPAPAGPQGVTGSGVKSLAEKTPEEIAAEEKVCELPEAEIEEAITLALDRAGDAAAGEFPALAAERRKRAVLKLAEMPHPLTLEALKKLVNGKFDSDVRATAAFAIGHMKFARKDAAKFLVKRIDKDWDDSEVLIGIARGLGELQLVPDREEMHRYFKHKDDAVYVSMIVCIGQIKDVGSLPKLEEIFAQFGKVSTTGVSVRVDTGAAGTKDQQAAEARGRSMLQKAKVDRRDGAIEAVTRAVKDITGVEFEFADKFHEWLVEHEKELKIKVKK